jgi:putative mRNA 3-end processing factor
VELSYNRGIILRHGNDKLLLDPEYTKTPIGLPTIVTHAHSDHTAALSGSCKTYITRATLDLFQTTQKNARNYIFKDFYEPFEIGSFEVEMIKAGHLLGAAQIVVRQGNSTFHYTGDFCPEALLTLDPADIPKDVDVCVMDATYGDSRIQFNSRPETRQRLFVWAISEINSGKLPVVNVAHMGGAQELIKLFNQLASNLPILVHPKIREICEVYEKNGINLQFTDITSPEAVPILKEKTIILIPRAPKSIDSIKKYLTNHKIVRGMVTGQTAKYGFSSFNHAASLSTHASFTELVKTAKEVNPTHLYTYFGQSDRLAISLRDKYQIPSMELKFCRDLDISELSSGKDRKASYLADDPWKGWYE